jgi:sulfite reductase (NADPH) flavoprotein alpha-component
LLTPAQLAAKIQAANPNSKISTLTVSSVATAPAQVQFVSERGQRGGGAGPGEQGPMAGMQGEGGPQGGDAGPGGGQPGGVQYANPYTGELLPQPGATAESFFQTTEQIHRGMWAGRDTKLGSIVSGIMGYSALFLLIMIPTGLYLRWPRGIAAGQWRSWFAINFKLKGKAFLYSLHAVIGTFVLLVYLVSAHTGTMINREVSWYSNGVRSAAGLQQRGGPGEGGPGEGGPQQGGPPGEGGPQQGGQPGGGFPGGGQSQVALSANLGAAWAAFQAAVPAYNSARLAMAADGSPVLRVSYIPKGKTAADSAILAFDANSGAAVADTGGAMPSAGGRGEGGPRRDESFLTALIGGSEEVHTGRFFGAIGQFVMGFSGLMMPVLLISGYMMYLDRRRLKRERLAKAAARA